MTQIFFAYPGWQKPSACDGCRFELGDPIVRVAPREREARQAGPGTWYAPDFLEADAVVFHVPTTPLPVLLAHRPGQLWVAWSAESESNYPQLVDPAFMRNFDLTVTYRDDADVRLSDIDAGSWLPFRPPPIGADGYEPAPAILMASSFVDRSGRIAYARELMRHMPVDSYGVELGNRRMREDRGIESKLALLARYRFTLAFENSIAPDYVTEKLYQPLLAGSLPVYLGAPNVERHAPARESYIDVSDFRRPADLAAFLLGLRSDPARYARYFEWHERPLAAQFLARADAQRVPPACRLCRLVQAKRAGALRT